MVMIREDARRQDLRTARTDLIVRRYRALANIGVEAMDFLGSMTVCEHRRAGGPLAVLDQGPPPARFLAEGWGCRYRLLSDGRRQILSFLVPGDAIGLCERPSPIALANAATLTAVQIIDATPLAALLQEGGPLPSGLREALRVAAGLDEVFLMDNVVRNGRQSAQERLCHLILELNWRVSLTKPTPSYSMSWPLTQDMLADAVGLSVVHVNRTLQQLRLGQLIETRSGVLTILKPERLAEIGDYQPPLLSAA